VTVPNGTVDLIRRISLVDGMRFLREKRGTVTYLVKMITRNGQIDTVWQDHDGTVSTSGTESPHVHYALNEAMDYHRYTRRHSPV
jgi:hypothetical protein